MQNSNTDYISMQNTPDQKYHKSEKNSLNEQNRKISFQNIQTRPSDIKSDEENQNNSGTKFKTENKDQKLDDKSSKTGPQMAQNPKKALKRLLSYSFRYKINLILGLSALAVSSFCQVLIPYMAAEMISVISDTKDGSMDKLGNITLLFLLVNIVGGLSTFVRGFNFNYLGEKVMYAVRNELFAKIVEKDTEFFDVNKSGELMSRITSDTALLQSAASDNISMLLREVVQLIGSLAFLFVLSYELTLYMFAIIPVVVIIIGVFVTFYKKFTKEYQTALSKANGYATEAIGNIRVVKSFGTENKEKNIFDRALYIAFGVGKKRSLLFGVFVGSVSMVGFCAIVLVLYLGGRLVIQGDMTVGDLSGFVLYTITMAMSLIGTGGVVNTIVTALGASEKIFEIMDTPVKIQNGTQKPQDVKGEITFEDVQFKYPTKENVNVLKTVNFEIKRGQNVAFVGSSGSGKSSIISLIERFYDIQSGSIKLDGVDIKQLDLQWLHQNIGFVSQEPTLFAGTLKENITYGVENATDQQIEESIKMANAYDFIHDYQLFPEGLETIVGERGVKLSGGQKQRIAIARALIKNPAILIFDEATSALDAESEYQVQYAIDQLVQRGEKTIIIIAHRLSTIIKCDNIIVIEKGEIKEQGSHQALLNKNDVYSKLIQRQLQGLSQEEGEESA